MPWLQRLQQWRLPGTARMFPAMTRLGRGGRRVTTTHGFEAEGFRVEPGRSWTWRQQAAALGRVVLGAGQLLGFQGMRVGHTSELKRCAQVSDVVRRVVEGRSVRDLIGAEDAYATVFEDDMAAATTLLGRLRIEENEGLCRVVASSVSAGRVDDWVPVAGTPAVVEVDAAPSSSSSDAEPSGSEAGAATGCTRCNRVLARRDVFFRCSGPGCTAVACPNCHPAGGTFACRRHSGYG